MGWPLYSAWKCMPIKMLEDIDGVGGLYFAWPNLLAH